MSGEQHVVIEVFGEGKTDVGHEPRPQEPIEGVVPILLHRLCGRPKTMLVKRYGIPFLQQKAIGRGWKNKAKAARKLAQQNRSHAAVFVVDSEGDLAGRSEALKQGREAGPSHPPMVIGIAHPCIESWLLADAAAIRRALDLPGTPDVPAEPETLPAPCEGSRNNPKEVLRNLAGATTKELPVREKDEIAKAMNDMHLVRKRCPLGFAPFADEVDECICPLF